MATSIIRTNGMIPDYTNATTPTFPFTAPSNGYLVLTVGNSTSFGTRELLIDGVSVGRVSGGEYMVGSLTAIIGKGQVATVPSGVWGTATFIPFK